MAEKSLEVPVDTFKDTPHSGRPNEVAGCPTGLVPEDLVEKPEDHEPLVIEKL